MVVPFVSSVTLRTFRPGPQVITSATDIGGRTTFTLYDGAFRPTGNIGPNGELRELMGRGLSRRGSSDDSFDAANPNTGVTMQPANGGHVESFRDGGSWATRWTPSASGDWTAGDGRLISTSSNATLTWAGSRSDVATALSFQLIPVSGQTLSLSIGDFTLGYDSGYTASLKGTALTALITPTGIARHWMVVFDGGAILVFVDGLLLYSQNATPASGAVSLQVGTGGALRNLAMGLGAELGVTYTDAAARTRQAQSLNGDDSVVAGTVFDGMNRQLATTKAIPGSFGAAQTRRFWPIRIAFWMSRPS